MNGQFWVIAKVVQRGFVMKLIKVGRSSIDIEHGGEIFRLGGELTHGKYDFYAHLSWTECFPSLDVATEYDEAREKYVDDELYKIYGDLPYTELPPERQGERSIAIMRLYKDKEQRLSEDEQLRIMHLVKENWSDSDKCTICFTDDNDNVLATVGKAKRIETSFFSRNSFNIFVILFSVPSVLTMIAIPFFALYPEMTLWIALAVIVGSISLLAGCFFIVRAREKRSTRKINPNKDEIEFYKCFIDMPDPGFVRELNLEMDVDYTLGLGSSFIARKSRLNVALSDFSDDAKLQIREYISNHGNEYDKEYYNALQKAYSILCKYYDERGNAK